MGLTAGFTQLSVSNRASYEASGLGDLFHVVTYTNGLFCSCACASMCVCVFVFARVYMHACACIFHVAASGVDLQVPFFLFFDSGFLISLEFTS